MELFAAAEVENFVLPTRHGVADRVTARPTAKILHAMPNGYLETDYTINNFVGCSHSCSYCYAAGYVEKPLREDWGKWVDVKTSAVAQLRKDTRWRGRRLLMGTATDPYQPLEQKIELTRQMLEVLVEDEFGQPAHLCIMSRGPLITRDLDLLTRFKSVSVSFSITTDDDDVRKLHEPMCASIDKRFEAATQLAAAGIPVRISIAPMLPLRDPKAFADRLKAIGAAGFFMSTFNPNGFDGKPIEFRSITRDRGIQLLQETGWSPQDFARDASILRRELNLGSGPQFPQA